MPCDRLKQLLSLGLLTLLILRSTGAPACSTFVLENGGEFLYAHHLDTNGNVPGLVVINKRGTRRTAVSWEELVTAKQTSTFSWTSRFGSITFNTWGLGFPDGGMNECGLYIQEMSLGGSRSARPENRPLLFASVWMQYVLDNLASVTEVVHSASEFGIEGEPAPTQWHFLVADRQGGLAVIEFLEGRLVVHQRSDMPVPLLANGTYEDDVKSWQQFAKAPGRDGSKPDRFTRGAQAIQVTSGDMNAAERAERVLGSLQQPSTQWTYIFDRARQQVRYRTKSNPEWRSFSWANLHFVHGTALAWDINDGDRRHWFQPFSPEDNRRFANRAIDALLTYVPREGFESYLRSMGGSSAKMRLGFVRGAH